MVKDTRPVPFQASDLKAALHAVLRQCESIEKAEEATSAKLREELLKSLLGLESHRGRLERSIKGSALDVYKDRVLAFISKVEIVLTPWKAHDFSQSQKITFTSIFKTVTRALKQQPPLKGTDCPTPILDEIEARLNRSRDTRRYALFLSCLCLTPLPSVDAGTTPTTPPNRTTTSTPPLLASPTLSTAVPSIQVSEAPAIDPHPAPDEALYNIGGYSLTPTGTLLSVRLTPLRLHLFSLVI